MSKKLKIQFWRAEKALAMQILEQEGLPKEKNDVLNLFFSNISEAIKPKSAIPFPYEEIMNTKYIGVPMYIYIPNYNGVN